MHRRSLLLAPILLPALASAAPAEPAPRVVASFSILGDMVREVAGDRVALTTLVGPDGDAHAFEPTAADVTALAGADLVVANGLGLEAWLDRLVAAAGYHGPVAIASEGIEPRRMEEDGSLVPDPHAWQDVRNAILYVRRIAAALGAADPSGGPVYRRNAQAYAARLEALDATIRAAIAAVPEPRRKIVTSHDAFGYFGAAYGVRFLALQGVSEESEPSARDLRRLIDQIRREQIKVLFLENALSPRLVQRIAEETGARVGGTLYADALSRPDGPAGSYVRMVEHNVRLLLQAMQASGAS